MFLKTLYTAKESDDLHFYMAKVMPENKDAWKEFAKKSEEGVSGQGVAGFLPSLEFCDKQETEVWIAFVSNKEVALSHEIDDKSIEMFVTVSTSDNAPFTSHMGIARSSIFNGVTHQNISTKLHAFAAEFMCQQHPEKAYMINTPTAVMRNIMMNTFLEKGLGDKITICEYKYKLDWNVEHSLEYSDRSNMEVTLSRYDDAKEDYRKAKASSRSPQVGRFEATQKALLDIQVLQQRQDVKAGLKSLPVSIEALDLSFKITDKSGNITTIDPESQHEEFVWFFGHQLLFQGINGGTPLITCDLEALASWHHFDDPIHLVGDGA